ncbi:PH domain-containing protein [Streptomyces sp. Je 1-4]|uniref:PH domain-containing protein n=1 Tax=Streptomyces TaxID=1883 RepID=UPI0021D93C43|nr:MULTISPECIES: PH domain-containing protein [unclassified Streptomyces]UYB43944.1 PH domain-containing protein [Streptomyces sp. Je 1-4]UZQ40368.1 PH domain-containing protein [Streptomyces sp. Je 1-4] [Streptomyces sp. Je 1-4 4N24]UZQ47785.1 PH domain-containing protein [Streptomyces sp. Je 1-4] [Streptomyces sp. Je 1-4 4N24_ara]
MVTELTIALLVFVPLSLIGHCCTAGRTYIGAEGVRTRTPLRRRFIPWHAVERIYVDLRNGEIFGRRGPVYQIRLDLVNGESFCLLAPGGS